MTQTKEPKYSPTSLSITPQSTLSQITSHPQFGHFVLYLISYILLGQVITCLGPMFPYLAVHQNKVQTQYSFLFSTRALGFMLGSISLKIIGPNLFTLHQIIGIGVSLMSIFSILFNMSQNLYFKGICIFLSSVGGSFQDIAINMSALQCYKGQNVAVWLQAIHGGFAIGGLLGPFVVYLFQLHALTVLGGIAIFTLIFYYILVTPQKIQRKNQVKQQQIAIQIPKRSIILISLCFFFSVGQEVSYGGWISSYAVLYGFSTKQHATFYSSLYWISITFFRLVLAILPGKPSYKIEKLAIIGAVSSFISYYLIFKVHPQFGLIIMSILFGLCNSVLFPLLLTVPQQFGFKLTVDQSTTFIISASLGQGCLAVGVGKMMGWFSYNWLIYGIFVMNIAIIGCIRHNATFMTNTREQYQKTGKVGKLGTFIQDYDKNNNYAKSKQGKSSIQMKLIQK